MVRERKRPARRERGTLVKLGELLGMKMRGKTNHKGSHQFFLERQIRRPRRPRTPKRVRKGSSVNLRVDSCRRMVGVFRRPELEKERKGTRPWWERTKSHQGEVRRRGGAVSRRRRRSEKGRRRVSRSKISRL